MEKWRIKRKEIIESRKDIIEIQGKSEEEYDEELAKKIIKMTILLEDEYMKSHNLTQLEAYEKANKEILNYPIEKFI